MARQRWIADKLREYNLDVVEHDGWQTRGSSWFFPKGVVGHHTGGAAGKDVPSLDICINGRADLRGPLCHVLISRSAQCHIIAAGRANHAGSGSWNGLTGNRSVFGVEVENTGLGEPWKPDVVRAFDMAAAALLDGLGVSSEYYCGHKEWTSRKIDPEGLDMNAQRARIQQILDTGGPVTEPTRDQWRAVQQALVDLGVDPGPVDGIPGPLTQQGLFDAYLLAGGRDLQRLLDDCQDQLEAQRLYTAGLVAGIRDLATDAAALADRTLPG